MLSKKINHSFHIFTPVATHDIYFENPKMIEGEKQAGFSGGWLQRTANGAPLGCWH
jgi:hypothetical protein